MIIVRHAEAEGNKTRCFHGHSDSDITENGMRQLEFLRRRFETVSFDRLYSSDLKRAYKTACAIRGERDMEIVLSPLFREINGGDWEGRPWAELPAVSPELYSCWNDTPHLLKFPNGEPWKSFRGASRKPSTGSFGKTGEKRFAWRPTAPPSAYYLCGKKGLPLEDLNRVGWVENTAVTILDFDDKERAEILLEGTRPIFPGSWGPCQNRPGGKAPAIPGPES
jgi:probable phosphoglycerate mutase